MGEGYRIYSIESLKKEFDGKLDNLAVIDTSDVWEYRLNKAFLKRNGFDCNFYYGYDITCSERKDKIRGTLLRSVESNDSPINAFFFSMQKMIRDTATTFFINKEELTLFCITSICKLVCMKIIIIARRIGDLL